MLSECGARDIWRHVTWHPSVTSHYPCWHTTRRHGLTMATGPHPGAGELAMDYSSHSKLHTLYCRLGRDTAHCRLIAPQNNVTLHPTRWLQLLRWLHYCTCTPILWEWVNPLIPWECGLFNLMNIEPLNEPVGSHNLSLARSCCISAISVSHAVAASHLTSMTAVLTGCDGRHCRRLWPSLLLQCSISPAWNFYEIGWSKSARRWNCPTSLYK